MHTHARVPLPQCQANRARDVRRRLWAVIRWMPQLGFSYQLKHGYAGVFKIAEILPLMLFKIICKPAFKNLIYRVNALNFM